MIFAAVAPIFVAIALGFLLRRTKVLTEEADRSLLRICVNLLYPCLIANSILGNELLREGVNLWLTPLTGVVMVGLGYLVSFFGARALRIPHGPGNCETRTFIYITGLYNYGYTAIPLVEKLFGAKTLGVLFTHNLGVEIAFWAGAGLILAGGGQTRNKPIWRQILSTPVIAILASVVLNFFHPKQFLPDWIFGGLGMIGAAAIPMALLLTGATLSDLVAEAGFSRSRTVAAAGASVIRLGVLPLVFIAVARWLPCPVELKQVLIVQAAMPCAMLPVVLTKHYGGDSAMAVQIVFMTTALSLLTIPYWIDFGMKFAGL